MARHHVVFGLGFGDEGKGTITDFIARRERPAYVVRFNGGAQAAHNVVLADGRHHTFAQYGSGAFAGARTFLSRFMIVNPLTMLNEREELLRKGGETIAFVDARALITTPYHVAINRLRESVERHGSCGMGVGETVGWAQRGVELRAGDVLSDDLEDRLSYIRGRFLDVAAELLSKAEPAATAATKHLRELPSAIAAKYRRWAFTVGITPPDWLARQIGMEARCLFEGAQGVLLDETHGWAPHYTWSTCTPKNALELLGEAGVMRDDIEVTGVLRAYHTRHGAGPFPTESLRSQLFPEAHNGAHPWAGDFRCGLFDAPLARYALNISGRVDGLAITHLDRKPDWDRWIFCSAYDGQPLAGKPDIETAVPVMSTFDAREGVLPCLRAALPLIAPPIKIASYGPAAADKREVA